MEASDDYKSSQIDQRVHGCNRGSPCQQNFFRGCEVTGAESIFVHAPDKRSFGEVHLSGNRQHLLIIEIRAAAA